MHYRTKLIILLSLWNSFSAIAQKLPEIKKGTYTDSSNRYYHNFDLPAYLFMGTSGTAAPSPLFSSAPNAKTNPAAPFFFKSQGKNVIRLDGNDKTKEVVSEFIVYVDGKPPKSQAIVKSSNKSLDKSHVYYGQGLNITIEAEDDLSGVNTTYISINTEDFQPLNGQISLQDEGDFTVNFFSTDNVGNVEAIQKVKISVDFTAPKTNLNISGPSNGNTLSLKSKLQLSSEDNISSTNTSYYLIDNTEKILYKGGAIPLSQLKDGYHKLEYFSVDKVFNQEEVQSYDFFLDRSSPIVTTDILGDKFHVNDKIYFSGRTKLKLTAVDNKSGVKDIYYALDSSNYIKYENPFYMPNKSGQYAIRYYATDKLENQGSGDTDDKFKEYKHNGGVIYVDLTGPTLNYVLTGPSITREKINYINSKTLVKLSGVDPESGLQKLTYRYDSLSEEMVYSQPFSVTADSAGKILFYGYDNVNNRNLGKIRFVMDNEAPAVTHKFSQASLTEKDGIAIYPYPTALSIKTTDDKSGVGTVYYSINGNAEIPLKAPIIGFEKNKSYKVKIRAVDKLGNQGITEIAFQIGK